MISVHGNKTMLAGVLVCCSSLAMVLGTIASELRMKYRLCEKEVSLAVTEQEEKNQREISESNISGAANSDFENEIK